MVSGENVVFVAGRTCRSVVELLDDTAERYPHWPAVESQDRSLTYAALRRVSGAIAAELSRRLIGDEQRVAVVAPMSNDCVAEMCGVMRAGGAYVVVDNTMPSQYLRELVQDASARAMVGRASDLDEVGDVGVPRIPTALDDRSESSSLPLPHEDGLATVIYTSGSTGIPKGVMITHRGLLNLAAAASDEFRLSHQDRVLCLAPPSFSASLEEVFPAMVAGATVVFPSDRRIAASTRALIDELARSRITVVELQTLVWQRLIDWVCSQNVALPSSLRLVIVGGERMNTASLKSWAEISDVPIVHVYGPTECTATVTYARLDIPHLVAEGRNVPIGRPIRGTDVYLLDGNERIVSGAGEGELWVSGDSLARGYLGRLRETAEAFRPHPRGARIYRTGDRVRRGGDGSLTFLGRGDHQVKVNGMRIEPAHVEAVLQAHTAVREVFVHSVTGKNGHGRLVAYVSLVPDADVTIKDLRLHLAASMPSGMLPERILVVPELPMTAFGKIDRAKLPNPFQEPRS